MEEIFAVMAGAVFLHIFFRAVESTWPASYFALASGPDYAISRSLFRYMTFRLVPVVVVSTYVAATLSRSNNQVVLPVIGLAALHACLTSGRALWQIIRAREAHSRPLLVLLHPIVMVAVVASAALGALSWRLVAGTIPPVNEIVSDLWTGVVAGVVGAYAVRVTQQGTLSTEEIFRHSRGRISDALWVDAEAVSRDCGADVELVRAVMLVENIQRPAWFRALERVGARTTGRQASMGLLQIAGSPDESDKELLGRGIRSRFVNRSIRGPKGHIDHEKLKAFAREYNPDPKYFQLLQDAIYWVEHAD